MRTIQLVAVSATLMALTLTGCSTADITASDAVSPAQSRLSKSKGVERPWKGDCIVYAQITSATTLTFAGTCQLAHMGRTSVVAYQTITAVPSGFTFTNTATYTAANGDELHTITTDGTATPSATGLTLAGTETAVGGTGRFVNASGTATMTGTVRFDTGIGAYRLDGRLTY